MYYIAIIITIITTIVIVVVVVIIIIVVIVIVAIKRRAGLKVNSNQREFEEIIEIANVKNAFFPYFLVFIVIELFGLKEVLFDFTTIYFNVVFKCFLKTIITTRVAMGVVVIVGVVFVVAIIVVGRGRRGVIGLNSFGYPCLELFVYIEIW